jgi:hypothetical protein
MVDYHLNSDLDIEVTDSKEVQKVTGLAEFEQDLMVRLRDAQSELLDSDRASTTKERIRLKTTRIAREMDVIESIGQITVTRSRDLDGSYDVEVTYRTGDRFTEQI